MNARKPFPKLRPIAAVISSLFASSPLQAQQGLPSGLQVVSGQASLQQNGSQLTVNNSNNAILNWNSFSIGAGNSVNFVQPSSSSQVLNRVIGNDPSQILGNLSSNGRVWLLNPNGVLFGRDARVDVGSLVASTLNISNENWLAGRYALSGSENLASIDNQGQIRAASGGQVALIGGSVSNSGSIQVQDGEIVLAAGQSVELVDTGAPHFAVKVTAPVGEVVNLGSIDAGSIDVVAAAVNQQGLVRAEQLSTGAGGEIVLDAADRLTLAGGSQTRADGSLGGRVELTGREIELQSGSLVSASGSNGGGAIFVGGGAAGRDPSIRNADAVYVAPGASLVADALQQGNGGHIVLWSEHATRAFGLFSARGGADGGNGGLIETSGHWLDARPQLMDLTAARGRAGTWLLDPYNVVITTDVSDSNTDASFTATGDDATISDATINQALASGANVVVSTGGGGSQAGTISVQSATLQTTTGTPASLTLNAAGGISISNSQFTGAAGAPLTLSFNAGLEGAGGISIQSSQFDTFGGNVAMVAADDIALSGANFGGNSQLAFNMNLQSGSSGIGSISLRYGRILSSGGDVSIGGFGTGGAAVGGGQYADGIDVEGFTLDAGTGRVSLIGATAAENGNGVSIATPEGSSSINGGDVSITGTATGAGGTGVYISGSDVSASGLLSLTGTGVGAGVAVYSDPFGGATSLTGTAGISITGTSTGGDVGVVIDDSGVDPETASSMLVADGSGISITGSTPADGVNAISVTGAAGVPVFGGTGDVTLQSLIGSINVQQTDTTAGIGTLTLSTPQTLTLNNGTLGGQGAINLQASDIVLQGQLVLAPGLTSGTALSVTGAGGTGPANSFDNQAGSGVFALPAESSSRWIVWLNDATTSGALNLGGLDYSFQRYGATSSDAWVDDVGNGVVSYATKTLSISGSVASRAYDGTTLATVTNATATPEVAGDQVVSNAASGSDQVGAVDVATANFVDKNAGTGKAVDVSLSPDVEVLDSSGHPVYGYTLQSNLSGDITPAVLSATVTGVNRAYDGTTTAGVLISSLNGLVGDETVTVSGSGVFADANAGTGKAITATYSLADGSNGGLASNYQFVNSQPVTANITPALLSGTVTGVNRVYDGTTTAGILISGLSGFVGNETVTVNGSGVFADANAGTGKAITATYSLADGSNGGLASNYQFVYAQPITANITPAVLSGTVTGVNRVYDGTTTAGVLISGLSGFVGNETVIVNGSGVFADRNVGNGKTITASYTLADGSNGGLASNYQFVYAQPVTANITPAVLSGTVTGVNRVYDGTTTAGVLISGLSGFVGNETVIVNGSGVFADRNVGNGKTITTSYTLADGSNGGLASNYQFVYVQPVTASITPASLSYVATPAVTAFGAALPSLSGTLKGFVGGDSQQTATTGTLLFSTNAGNTPAPGVYSINGSGLSAANYVFVQDPGNATALTVVDNGGGQLVASTQIATTPSRNAGAPQPNVPSDVPSGFVDVATPPPGPSPQPGTNSQVSFDSVAVESFTPESLAALLDARSALMQDVLGSARDQLAKDPTLADVGPCETLEQALKGTCVLTDKLKARVAAGRLEAKPSEAGTANAPIELPPLFGMPVVKAAALPAIRRKVAVLIGQGTYSDPKIPGLANALGDARAIAGTLNEQLGYETLVLENPSKQTLIATLNRLVLEMGPEDSAVVFYAGHGTLIETTGEGYWLASSSQAEDPTTWVSNADIARLIEKLGAKQIALISDSCYSGSLVGKARIRGRSGELDPRTVLAQRSAVVMSSGGNEPVFDSGRGGHSLFAWSLMGALSKIKEWQPGGNLFERVRFTVARELPQRPQYGAAPGYQEGGDYLFEVRQLESKTSSSHTPS